MKINQQNLENYTKEMLSVLAGYYKSIDNFKKNYENRKPNISIEKINYCLDKYINSEFDYITPGNRGLGRVSDYWPRLAAYFRNTFLKLPSEKNHELDSLITSLIIKSYLFFIIIADNKIKISEIKTGEQLYEKWIPKIYVFDLYNLGEEKGNLLFALIKTDYDKILNFFIENKMMTKTSNQEKIKEIINGYVVAGLVMIIVEEY